MHTELIFPMPPLWDLSTNMLPIGLALIRILMSILSRCHMIRVIVDNDCQMVCGMRLCVPCWFQELLHQRTAWEQVQRATSHQPDPLLGGGEGLPHLMPELLAFDDLKHSTSGPKASSAADSSAEASGPSQASAPTYQSTDVASQTDTPQPGRAALAASFATKGASAAQGAAASNTRCRACATEPQQGVEAMARRAFALLASRCMDPDPSVRPSFADAAARLEILQRAVAGYQGSGK
jgi:hypothetical protein